MIASRDWSQAREELPSVLTVSAALEQWATSRSDEIFSTFVARGVEQTITFSALYERSLAYCRYYRSRGVQAGDLIIIILEHTPHQFYSYLGAMLLGAVPSFLPFPTPKQRADIYWAEHKRLFDRIAPRCIVTYEANLAVAPGILGFAEDWFCIADDAILRTAVTESSIAVAAPDAIACLQHSSGTTGSKKGVVLTHRAIVDAVRSYSEALEFTRSDSIASWLPLYHDMGFIACFLASVVNGTRLVALDPFEWVARPARLLDVIERYRTSFCWLPNFALSHMVNACPRGKHWDLSHVRAFINCSEPCRVQTMERFVERFSQCGITWRNMHVCYALAENVFGVTQTPLDRPTRVFSLSSEAFRDGLVRAPIGAEAELRLVSCGSPVPGVELAVRLSDGGPVDEHQIGHIFIRSPFLFSAYYRLEASDRAPDKDGWYATRDVGFVQDGELYVTGRTDDMIVVNGRNFYAHEIEAIVHEIPGVVPGRAVAFGMTRAGVDATVVVVLVECFDDTVDSEVKNRAAQQSLDKLALYLDAVVVVPRGALVKTTSGKISRELNREWYLGQKCDASVRDR